MPPKEDKISFEGATGFTISGGNFGIVRGNLTTIDVGNSDPGEVISQLTPLLEHRFDGLENQNNGRSTRTRQHTGRINTAPIASRRQSPAISCMQPQTCRCGQPPAPTTPSPSHTRRATENYHPTPTRSSSLRGSRIDPVYPSPNRAPPQRPSRPLPPIPVSYPSSNRHVLASPARATAGSSLAFRMPPTHPLEGYPEPSGHQPNLFDANRHPHAQPLSSRVQPITLPYGLPSDSGAGSPRTRFARLQDQGFSEGNALGLTRFPGNIMYYAPTPPPPPHPYEHYPNSRRNM